MLLTGSYGRSVDEKQRVAIPKSLRESLFGSEMGRLYVAPGTDGSLALYPPDAFAELARRLGAGSPNARQTREYSRLFYSQAVLVELDAQGRVRIPEELARQAALAREVMLIGVGDHLELWDRPRWEEYRAAGAARYDEIAEAAFEPGPQQQPAAPSESVEPPIRHPR